MRGLALHFVVEQSTLRGSDGSAQRRAAAFGAQRTWPRPRQEVIESKRADRIFQHSVRNTRKDIKGGKAL
jgi:hypothetical protein